MEPIDPTYPEATPTFTTVKETPGLIPKIKLLVSIYSNSRLGRGMSRYSIQNGALLAGGITYVALFSITGALTIAVTVIMGLMGQYPTLRDSVLGVLDSTLPGVLALNGPDSGMIEPNSLIMDSIWSLPGLIGLIVLLFSASRLMNAVKLSVRAMFGIAKAPISFVSDKLRDFLGLLAIAGGALITGIISTINSQLGNAVLSYFGIEGTLANLAVKTTTLLLAGLCDAGIIYVLIRVVSHVHITRKDALGGLVIGAVLSAVLRFLGTSAVSAVKSPILASFTALITVLLWVNLLSRMLLMVSAFIANPPRSAVPINARHIHGDATPNYVTLSAPKTLAWPHHSITGSIDIDWDTNPNRPKEIDERHNYRGGPIARFIVRRIDRLEEKQRRMRRALRR